MARTQTAGGTIIEGASREDEWSGPSISHRWQLQRRFVSSSSSMIGLALLVAVCLLAILAPLIARYDPNAIDPAVLNQTPSAAHWFGTDYLGRDMWSRVLYGGRVSLLIGVAVAAIEAGIGVPLGLVAGYVGGAVDSILMRLVDVQLALPGLLLPLGVIAVLGPGLTSTAVALGLGGAPFYARMARGMTLRAREEEYVNAARALGQGQAFIVFRHVLPNVVDPLVVQATLGLGGAILAASALSYLGVGTQPPTADWGTLLSSGYEHMFQSWSELAFPGVAVSLAVLAINLVGDGLTDALNPRIRS